jgi:hypothetical protein
MADPSKDYRAKLIYQRLQLKEILIFFPYSLIFGMLEADGSECTCVCVE